MENVLITGATSGIGREFANSFAKEGKNIILVGRDEERTKKVKKELEDEYNANVKYYLCDLEHIDEVKEVCSKIQDETIDVFINNAGFNNSGNFVELNSKQIDGMINVNIVSFTMLLETISKKMKERKKGKVLNLGSTVSFMAGPKSAVYCASKAYVLDLSIALHYELKKYGVNVTTLCPGTTKTGFAKRANMQDNFFFKHASMEVKDVVRIGLDALNDNRVFVIAGYANKCMIRLMKFLPRTTVARIAGKLMV